MSNEEQKPARYGMPGRPPRAPRNKVGIPVRCLVTIGVQQKIEEAAKAKGINISDFLRLCIYKHLESTNQLTDELRKDATWDTLRGFGIL